MADKYISNSENNFKIRLPLALLAQTESYYLSQTKIRKENINPV